MGLQEPGMEAPERVRERADDAELCSPDTRLRTILGRTLPTSPAVRAFRLHVPPQCMSRPIRIQSAYSRVVTRTELDNERRSVMTIPREFPLDNTRGAPQDRSVV